MALRANDDAGVWNVPADGSDPEPFAVIEGFSNDVLCDRFNDRRLVSESFGGAVYEIPLDADDQATATSAFGPDTAGWYPVPAGS